MLSLDIRPTVNERLVIFPFGPGRLSNIGLIAERPSRRAIGVSKTLATVVKTSIEAIAFVIMELTTFVILLAAFGFLVVVVLFCVVEAGE